MSKHVSGQLSLMNTQSRYGEENTMLASPCMFHRLIPPNALFPFFRAVVFLHRYLPRPVNQEGVPVVCGILPGANNPDGALSLRQVVFTQFLIHGKQEKIGQVNIVH